MRHSGWSLVREGLRGHGRWPPAWRSRPLQPSYDTVIIGGGGHGLATAYYLAKVHGLRDVAVIEKGWIGGGNTGRNTTNVRSDYLFPESAALYDFSLRLYEGLSSELDYNIMLSQRGWIALCHTPHQVDVARHKVNALHCNGIDAMFLDRGEVLARVPMLNGADKARFPVRGAFLQPRGGTIRHDAVAWGYARAADRLGVHIIQDCAVTGVEKHGNRVVRLRTTHGTVACARVGMAVAGHSSVVARMMGFPLPVTSYCLQAMVTEPVKPILDAVVLSPSAGVYVNQSDKGEIVFGGMLDLYPSYTQRGNYAVLERVVSAVVELFPGFGHLRLMRSWGGVVDVVPDSSPILGPTPVDNVFINCGFGTGGFKAIPAGGYLLAHALATGAQHALAKDFGLDRFTTGRLVDEASAAGISH